MADLTEQERTFVNALIEHKGVVAAAAEAAGYQRTYGYALVRRLREEIIEAARTVLALNGTRAAFTMVDALDNDLPVHRDRLEAAKQVLDRIGVIKEEKITIDTELPAIFILPNKDPD